MASDWKVALAEQMGQDQAQLANDLWGSQQPAAPKSPSPVLVRIAEEVGDDQLLGEAALAWIKLKKQETLLAKLSVYYTQEQLAAMRAAAEATAN